ncbi:helix-turn-helix transcriptional regulator [Streptomyces sp. NPDC003077]|uniref:helix-turn-helix domain-containing protein n=1 Tax=Streptomyces sp. NPDC003077 TaxID=3154443 RepID=UPI0033B5684C
MTNYPSGPTPSASHGPDTAKLFGRRLQRLIDVVRPEGRQRYTDAQIAAYVGVSAQYIHKLRHGKSVPSVEKAQSLAELFAVEHVDYFLKPDHDPSVRAVERRLRALEEGRVGRESVGRTGADEGRAPGAAPGADEELWRRLREEHGVREIAMRAGQLSPEARFAVLGIVNQLFRSEKGVAPPERP